jgi:putative oxidoreductase
MLPKIALVARILLGLIFTVFGINFFIPFLPQPPLVGRELEFITALFKTGYIFPIIKTIEVSCGILLLANYFVPLALILLTPIVLNIFFFHFFLNGIGAAGMGIVMIVLGVTIAYSRKESFAAILKAK